MSAQQGPSAAAEAMIGHDLFTRLADIITEHYGERPISITICKPTLHRLWRIQAEEAREVRARKRQRRHTRALVRRKQRGLA